MLINKLEGKNKNKFCNLCKSILKKEIYLHENNLFFKNQKDIHFHNIIMYIDKLID